MISMKCFPGFQHHDCKTIEVLVMSSLAAGDAKASDPPI